MSTVTLDIDPATLLKIRGGKLFPMAWTNDAGEDVLMLIPTTWSPMARGQAIHVLDPEHFGSRGLESRLAQVALLVTGGNHDVAWKLLKSGWSPHEPFMV